jgi:hypothetical protein
MTARQITETIKDADGAAGLNDFQRRIGVGTVNYALGRTGPTRKRAITSEEGPARGTVGGYQVDHKDGRMDAVITPPTVTKSARSDI